MIRCVVVDDEKGAIDILSKYVKQTPYLELVQTYRDSIEALMFLTNNEIDLVFLDIDMPNLNGMQLSDLIKTKNMQVVFCTAYSEYAVESYERDALDYLLKPVTYDRFLKAIGKVQRKSRGKTEKDVAENKNPSAKIFIKSGSKIHQIDTEDLQYLKKDGHYIIFFTSTEKMISRMNMKELLDALPADNFVRIHKSYVVALNKIDTIEKHFVHIKEDEIPIGDSFKKEFFQRIQYSGT